MRLSNLKVVDHHEGRYGVTVDAENAGARAGDEVVEIYIRRGAASVTRPVAELKGFQRLTLQPGEKRAVALELGPRELGFYGLDMKFAVEPGEYEVMAGTDSAPGLSARLTVAP
ncbi:MAG: fibronectin type III-like domain-contianing protein [Elusimicrobia bacterium]|nr:fibronectin type III-like domain-contianing protein [Elusimicrobiota bacterium]